MRFRKDRASSTTENRQFSHTHAEDHEGKSLGEFDAPGKNGKDIGHFRQSHDPKPKVDAGGSAKNKQKGKSQGKLPLAEKKEISQDGAEKRGVLVKHNMLGGAGDSGKAGDNGKSDEKADETAGDHKSAGQSDKAKKNLLPHDKTSLQMHGIWGVRT